MKRWHLSLTEREKIRSLTRARVSQAQIARALGIGRDTVSKWQTQMKLPTRVPIPEKRIMRLFEKGWGGYRIARHLRVAVSAVYKVAHKNNFRRTDGVGYPQPHGNVAGFIEAIKRREGYIKHLAKRYGVGFCAGRRIAHEVLGTYRFRPGASKPPLDSAFPQKWPKTEGDFVRLASSIARLFGGDLPPFPEAVVRGVVASLPAVFADAPPEAIRAFSSGLCLALKARAAEDSLAAC
jgi:hypothetical protein